MSNENGKGNNIFRFFGKFGLVKTIAIAFAAIGISVAVHFNIKNITLNATIKNLMFILVQINMPPNDIPKDVATQNPSGATTQPEAQLPNTPQSSKPVEKAIQQGNRIGDDLISIINESNEQEYEQRRKYGVSLVSSSINATKKERKWNAATTARPGEEILYRMAITNDTGHAITNIGVRTIMPDIIEYVPGYAKLYYEDDKGVDRVGAVSDYIAKPNGVILPDLPAKHWVYVTYKAKIKNNTTPGIYAPDQQLVAKGISLSSNGGLVFVR